MNEFFAFLLGAAFTFFSGRFGAAINAFLLLKKESKTDYLKKLNEASCINATGKMQARSEIRFDHELFAWVSEAPDDVARYCKRCWEHKLPLRLRSKNWEGVYIITMKDISGLSVSIIPINNDKPKQESIELTPTTQS